MKLHESGEMYLETILILSKEKPDLHAIDISEHMGYSKPSVSRAVSILKEDGYITVDEFSHITLTKEGKKVARKIYERHTFVSELLQSIGVDEKTADEDACRIEHVISDKTFAVLKKHIKARRAEKKEAEKKAAK